MPENHREEPLRVGGDVKEPIEISRVQPVYPEAARKARGGSDREKHVAFCMLGHTAKPGPEVVDLCRMAVESDPRQPGIPSTKGSLTV